MDYGPIDQANTEDLQQQPKNKKKAKETVKTKKSLFNLVIRKH